MTILEDHHPALFPVMNTVPAQCRIGPELNCYTDKGDTEDFVILHHALAIPVKKNSILPSVMDAITSQRRVSAIPDFDAGESICKDVVILQQPLTIFENHYAALFSVMDTVAAQDRVGFVLNG